MNWRCIFFHNWKTTEWRQLPTWPKGFETRHVSCSRCGKVMPLTRQVRNERHKLIYY